MSPFSGGGGTAVDQMILVCLPTECVRLKVSSRVWIVAIRTACDAPKALVGWPIYAKTLTPADLQSTKLIMFEFTKTNPTHGIL